MGNSILFAKFIGPYILLIGVGLQFNFKIYRRIIEEFIKNAAIVYLAGLITFVAGLSIIIFHNIWAMDWRIIITVLGWIALIKGAWLVILPGSIAGVAELFLRDVKLVRIPWVIMLLIGIFLTVKGYR